MMQSVLKYALLYIFCGSTIWNTAQAANTDTLTSTEGIQYMTGGVGHDEVVAMRSYAKKFSLNLLFSEGIAGQAVTDVNVNIYDENTRLVFRVTDSQPLLYVNLPPGTYTILANYQGSKLRHKVSITEGKPSKVILNWKNTELDARESNE